jgi:hypothetical protein
MIGRLLTRGPGAARRPALNESGRTKSQRSLRSASLFAKWSNLATRNSNQTHTSNPTQNSSHVASSSEHIDLEGIANDGFGYTVHITATQSQDALPDWRCWKPSTEEPGQDAKPPPSRRIGIPKLGISQRRRERESGLDFEKQGIEAETTFDVRESFHENNRNTWDVRNTYRSGMSADEIEKSMELAAQSVDWAILDGRRHNALPSVQEHEPGGLTRPHTAYLPAHRRQGSNLRPQTSVESRLHSAAGSTRSKGILKKPSTPVDQFSSSRPISPSTLSYSTRGPSPVQPLNSSQWWAASSPYTPMSPASLQSNSASGESPAHSGLHRVSGSWSMALDTVYSPTLGQTRPGSYHSSVAGRDGSMGNGSEESLVIGEDSELEPPDTPNSLGLPIQKHP